MSKKDKKSDLILRQIELVNVLTITPGKLNLFIIQPLVYFVKDCIKYKCTELLYDEEFIEILSNKNIGSYEIEEFYKVIKNCKQLFSNQKRKI